MHVVLATAMGYHRFIAIDHCGKITAPGFWATETTVFPLHWLHRLQSKPVLRNTDIIGGNPQSQIARLFQGRVQGRVLPFDFLGLRLRHRKHEHQ
ncbi:hypothetical protein AVO43_11155 [Microbulbifer sp. ZGT114]|nr:hypothetical protein AVO43_11155 [Microbulbifer sp. ZGT114]